MSASTIYSSNEICAICLEDYSENPQVDCVLTSCQHLFHAACAQPWIAQYNSCPFCKKKFSVVSTTNAESSVNWGDAGSAMNRISSMIQGTWSDYCRFAAMLAIPGVFILTHLTYPSDLRYHLEWSCSI